MSVDTEVLSYRFCQLPIHPVGILGFPIIPVNKEARSGKTSIHPRICRML